MARCAKGWKLNARAGRAVLAKVDLEGEENGEHAKHSHDAPKMEGSIRRVNITPRADWKLHFLKISAELRNL